MSSTNSTVGPIHPDEKYKADKLGKQLTKGGLAAGLVLLAVSVVFGATKGDHWKHFFYAYLTAWTFVFSLCIGSLFFILIGHLARARWGIVLRRQAEFMVGAFPWVFALGLVFIIPVLAGYEDLYFWSVKQLHDDKHPLWHHMHHKAGWLDPFFFAGRYVVYFAIYIGLSRWFTKHSVQQDTDGDPAHTEKMRVWSGGAIVLFALTTIFAAMDLVMSLAPMWFSTIFSVNFFAGSMLATYCTLALLHMAIQRTGRLKHSVTVEHYHDLGKYTFGWNFFWIYTAFSQFMLIWYGNMQEETVFYNYRMFSQWQYVSIALVLGQWAFPYFSLLTRWTKRILPLLAFFSVWQLIFHYLDLYWNIMPNAQWTELGGWNRGPLQGDPEAFKVGFHAMDVTLLLGLVALWLAGVGKSMRGNLIPVNDPKLGAALRFENY